MVNAFVSRPWGLGVVGCSQLLLHEVMLYMPPKDKECTDVASERRRYNSPTRREQSANTRQAIIAAGAKLVHELPTWDDMQSLTFRAISKEAGVSERTVYRYFSTEKQLKDAIVQHLVEASGVDLSNIKLDNFAELTRHIFKELSSYSAASKSEIDPAFATLDTQRREALLNAVITATPNWNQNDQRMTAAMLDMLWDIPPYQRLLSVWGLESDSASQAVTWMIGLIESAIENGQKPSG